MKIIIILFYLISYSSIVIAKVYKVNRKLLGVSLNWQTNSYKDNKTTITYYNINEKRFGESLDPQCLWRSLHNGVCENTFHRYSKKINLLSRQFSIETEYAFDSIKKMKSEKLYQDYGGLSQGYILEMLKNKIENNIIVNYSGDFYLKNSFQLDNHTIILTDPLWEKIPFATISMNSGFIIASGSNLLGGLIRSSSDLDPTNRIQKVVLFAAPQFSGTRLDAWATAIIAGGKKTLGILQEKKKYRRLWGYIYFNVSGEPICSSNIKCEFDSTKRTIVVPRWENNL
ncbi:hypothetical protein OAB57_00260 [Bacteriovoracaceae bacterium]|nr:hypothetical protein [Bacteriovoracaceae bacterium]